MNLNINLTNKYPKFKFFTKKVNRFSVETWVAILATLCALLATWYSFANDLIVIYGDAESHLNIAKRVVDSITPGLAQLGGIWLPLPHMLMLPLVKIDFLWRTGLAGSIISGVAYIVTSLYIYKLTHLLTQKKGAAFFASLVFMLNPNVLYLQSTPMTELTLIVFFTLSSYYFVKFLYDDSNFNPLMLSAFFGFCGALSRYDGWFLVLAEAGILVLYYFPYQKIPRRFSQIREYWNTKNYSKLEGLFLMYGTLAFLAVLGWLFWGFLILGDPLYFTHSQFSAKSQQQGWLAKGELPAYHHLWQSFIYYSVAAMSNIGIIVFVLALVGLFIYVFRNPNKFKFLTILLLISVFAFYIVTLFLGQSIIFIPHLTPSTFEWTLFNARYGVMMVPLSGILVGILLANQRHAGKSLIIFLFILQYGLYGIGYSKVISYEDGVVGLSQAKRPDAENWLSQNYDNGLVLLDDYSRLTSILRSGIPMQNVIYIGNKPYWEESFQAPEKYAKWIIVQKGDDVWNNIYEPLAMQGRLYKYFEKAYTSPEILIFKRNNVAAVN